MKIAVCFNQAPTIPVRGENQDHISESGSEVEARAVASALQQLGHAADLIALGSEIAPFVATLEAARPDLVFNLCEGFWGESGRELHLAALFELLHLPHSGSPALTLGLTQNKALTKDLLIRHGLPTPSYLLVQPGAELPAPFPLQWPVIVKPSLEDASLGITCESVVSDEKSLRMRVRYIHERYRQGALVEEFIEGREFNAAVFGDSSLESLPVAEIRFHQGLARTIVSYSGKWLEDSHEYAATEPVCPAPLESEVQQRIQQLAVEACRLTGCRDYARVDFRLRDGIPYILEVNANPDISPEAGLARAARVAGIDYPSLIDRIVKMTIARKEKSKCVS